MTKDTVVEEEVAKLKNAGIGGLARIHICNSLERAWEAGEKEGRKSACDYIQRNCALITDIETRDGGLYVEIGSKLAYEGGSYQILSDLILNQARSTPPTQETV